jgi:pimeloyl-ACP methyl ester carboxylesterase
LRRAEAGNLVDPAEIGRYAGAMTIPTSCFVAIGNQPYHYLDFGGEGLPPLIFVHGTGFHAWLWSPYGEALRDQFHCYAVDQRWHGDSTREDRSFDWIHNGDDLAAFVRELGLHKPYFVGHSMGSVSIAFAEARHPGTVGRAVFIDPIIMGDAYYEVPFTLENHPMAAKTMKRRVVWDSHEQMVQTYGAKPPFDSWKPEFLRLYVQHGTRPSAAGGVELKCRPEHEAQVYLNGNRSSPWPHLENLDFPTMIVRPLKSDTLHVTRASEVAERMPQGRLIDVPEATHYLPMEEPETLIRIIRDFDVQTHGLADDVSVDPRSSGDKAPG